MTRLLRPSDIKEAVEWFCGTEVTHSHRRRSSQARYLFWSTLRSLGFTLTEIADVTGHSHNGVHTALSEHPADPQWVAAVLKRAEKMVDAEDA